MRISALSAILAVALVAAGCSSSDPIATPGQDASPTATSSEGGTLVAAISSDPGSLNPAITTSGGVHAASELLFNGLVELDVDGTPQPELAASWDVEQDGALYRFHLVEGVTWHDGRPFTAQDVKFAFEEVILAFHSRSSASIGQAIDSITVVDPHTIEFLFAQPYAPLLQQLGVTEAPIVPMHVYEGTDPKENPANLAPIGTGPFTFVSYTPDSEVRLAKNEHYFKPGLPILDEVVLRVIPDDGNALAALEAGEVDHISGVPGPEYARLRANPDIDFLATSVNPGGSNCIMTVSFNLDQPMFDDVRTREAVARAVDRQAFLDRVAFGQGVVAQAPISSRIPFAHHPDVGLPDHDVQEAERLLDEAGWLRDADEVRVASGVAGVEDGTPLQFRFKSFSRFSTYGELAKAQLAALGIDLVLDLQDQPEFSETVFVDRDFDTVLVSYCNGPDPEIGVRRMYISSNIRPIPFSNASAYASDVVDDLFDEALTTVDVAARTDLYARITEEIVHDLPYFWLVETNAVRAFRANCRDFSESGHFAETAACAR